MMKLLDKSVKVYRGQSITDKTLGVKGCIDERVNSLAGRTQALASPLHFLSPRQAALPSAFQRGRSRPRSLSALFAFGGVSKKLCRKFSDHPLAPNLCFRRRFLACSYDVYTYDTFTLAAYHADWDALRGQPAAVRRAVSGPSPALLGNDGLACGACPGQEAGRGRDRPRRLFLVPAVHLCAVFRARPAVVGVCPRCCCHCRRRHARRARNPKALEARRAFPFQFSLTLGWE